MSLEESDSQPESTSFFRTLEEKNDDLELEPVKAYWRWILNENDGKLYVAHRSIFSGLGFDANFTRWNVSFYIYNRTIIESDKLKKIKELKKAFENKEEDEGLNVFPAFNIAYGLDGEKKKNIGLAFGVFGVAFGASLYFLGSFWESLRLGFSADAFKYALDDFLAKQEEKSGEEVDIANDISVGLRALVVYDF